MHSGRSRLYLPAAVLADDLPLMPSPRAAAYGVIPAIQKYGFLVRSLTAPGREPPIAPHKLNVRLRGDALDNRQAPRLPPLPRKRQLKPPCRWQIRNYRLKTIT